MVSPSYQPHHHHVHAVSLVGDRPRSWLQWLSWVEFCYNTSYRSALHATPLEVLYGRPPSSLVSYLLGTARVAAIDRQLRDRNSFLLDIRARLQLAQDTMREHHDKQRRFVEFPMGGWVWLCLHHCTVAGMASHRRPLPSWGRGSSVRTRSRSVWVWLHIVFACHQRAAPMMSSMWRF